MRTIDADALIPLIQEDKIEGETLDIVKALGDGLQAETLNQACDRHIKMINSLPTIIAEPRAGHWIEKIIYSHSYAECSECKTVYSWSETETMRFCKRCGAYMRNEVRAFTDEELKTYQEVIDRKSIPTSVNIMNVMEGGEDG